MHDTEAQKKLAYTQKHESSKNILKIYPPIEDASDTEIDIHDFAKEMSNLVNYLQPVKFKSFEHAECTKYIISKFCVKL